MTAALMRRHAIHFDEHDHVSAVTVCASEDVVAQLRACLGAVWLEAAGVVRLPIADAAKAAYWAGGFSELTSPDYAATNVIYECLVYGVFNRFWDDGVDGALAGEESL